MLFFLLFRVILAVIYLYIYYCDKQITSIILVFQQDELSFKGGDLLYVFDQVTDTNWWKARCGNKTGVIPSNYGL